MDPVVHFEIPANDVQRAKKFYEKTFGWKITEWTAPGLDFQYFGVTTKKNEKDAGINGGLMQRKMSGQPLTVYMTVSSIDDALRKVLANGGQVVMGKSAIGETGWIGAFIDPEGNLVGVHEVNAKHKAQNTVKKTAKKKIAVKKKK